MVAGRLTCPRSAMCNVCWMEAVCEVAPSSYTSTRPHVHTFTRLNVYTSHLTPHGDPMSMSMYEASVPTFLHTLKSLKAILEKGLAHAEARKFDPNVLAASRLFPDMLPLTRQVQIASDAAKSAAARLAGVEPPKYEDTETTIPELVARDRQDDRLPAELQGGADRRLGRAHHQYSNAARNVYISRGHVSASLGVAQFLLSCDDCLQPVAPQWRGAWQSGLPWGSALNQPGA